MIRKVFVELKNSCKLNCKIIIKKDLSKNKKRKGCLKKKYICKRKFNKKLEERGYLNMG
jgi:hypothetical protein